MEANGLEPYVGRLRAYKQSMATVRKRIVDSSTDCERLAENFFESYEILLAMEAMSRLPSPPPGLNSIVSDMLKGPEASRDESLRTSSNHARNRAFELIFAAQQVAVGASELEFAEPDIRFRYRKKTWFVACKRVWSSGPLDMARDRKAVQNLVRKARKQLLKTASAIPVRTKFGIIALDASKLINPHASITETRTIEEGAMLLKDMLAIFYNETRHIWPRLGGQAVDGCIVRIASPFFTDDNKFAHCQEWLVIPVNKRLDRYSISKLKNWAIDIGKTPS